jgi:phosphocarrier protein
MPEITLVVEHEEGLHLRPAAKFIRLARSFECDIKVTHGDRIANAKSELSVMTLGAHKGAEITIKAEGDDANEALAALKELINNNFGE